MVCSGLALFVLNCFKFNNLKIITINIQGLADKVKRTKVFRYIREQNVDIALLQETHSTKNCHKIWKAEWGGNIRFSDGISNAQGVAILFKRDFEGSILDCNKRDDGRLLSLQVKVNSQTIRIVNVYAPNEDRPEFFAEMFDSLQQTTDDYYVVAGDLNVILNPKLDKRGGKSIMTKSSKLICDVMDESDWIDVWRHKHENKFQFTWKRNKPLLMSRLDYFLVPLGTAQIVSKCEILIAEVSDHCPVILELQSDFVLRGPGYWKLNIQHIQQKECVDSVNETFDIAENKFKTQNPTSKWESTQYDVKDTLIKYARDKAQERKKQKDLLQKQAKTLKKKLNMINVESEKAIKLIQKTNDRLEQVKTDLNKIYETEAKGAIICAKARWVSQSEHSTKYFFNLEKQNAKSKIMRAIYDSQGNIVRNQGRILREQANYYGKLYSAKRDFECKIDGNPEVKLSNEMRDGIDSEITIEEVQNCIKDMSKGKSPGLSGLPIEFYIVFWNKIKKVFMEMVKFVHAQGLLHKTAREGIITLLPKKDRDLLHIKCWRLIILLNLDFKIISKVLANRLKTVLNVIIGKEQTGFVKGRLISENLRKILDVLSYAKDEDVPGIFISIDFEKAFDMVEYDCVWKTMKWFNFGDNLINWLRILFTDFTLLTYNNGYFSEPINASKGLFQGNPVAPYLFIIVIEVLATKLRQNNKIKGFKMGNIELLLTLFADDLGLLLDFDEKSWSEVVNELAYFQNISGMTVNYEKTTVYRFGSLKNSNAKFYSSKKLNWTNEPFKLLGITIVDSEMELLELNYTPLIEKAESLLRIWKQRDLSLFGKVLIVNSLIMSLFVYKFSVLPFIMDLYVKKLYALIKDFIWGGIPKISMKVIYSLKKDDGAGLIDTCKKDITMKLQWVSIQNQQGDIQEIADFSLENVIGQRIWQLTLRENHHKKIFQKRNFWVELHRKWCKISYHIPKNAAEARSQVLWWNSNICIENTPILYPTWVQKGIFLVGDLCDVNGQLLSLLKFRNKFDFYVQPLEYYGVISAIPKSWKVTSNDSKPYIGMYERILKVPKVSKFIYKELSKDENVLHKYVERLNTRYELRLSVSDLKQCIQKIKSITICVKL